MNLDVSRGYEWLQGRAWVLPIAVALITVVLMWLFSRVGRWVESSLLRLSKRTSQNWDDLVLTLLGRMARRLLPLLALPVGVSLLPMPALLQRQLHVVFAIGVIVAVAWVMLQIVDVSAAFVLRRHRVDVSNNLQARAVHTQVSFLRKTVNSLIVIIAVASALMVFDSVRQFGASILASAGIAGIAVGLAAQRSLSTLFAGLQIAITQPIRVDDVVIVEGEWGRVEEIALTYVVVRIWDERRLVVPIAHFIEKPFQNWTRTNSELLGSVFLYVDYGVSMERLRDELTRILKASPLWDGRVNVLQVTDVKERMIELRALASANDAGQLWDLRCEIREKLVAFVNRHDDQVWPTVRTSLNHGGDAGSGAAPVAMSS